MRRDRRGGGEGLDVIHECRLVEEAAGDGEGRAVARDAALALERLDERRFLAADVGAGAQMNLDIEGAARAEAIVAEQA